MLDTIITSSILIMVVITLRFIFGNKISRRLRYAMWGLVLLRLIIPVQILSSPLSVMNIITYDNPSTIQTERIGYSDNEENMQSAQNPVVHHNLISEGNFNVTGSQVENRTQIENTSIHTLRYVLLAFWIIGALFVALWFVASNLRLYRTLRIFRYRVDIKGSQLPVYVVDGLLSPCLFGIFKPAIYLTKKSMETQTSIDHVMTHELTHYIQKDHLWTLFRGICLSIYWFNPLVWIAAWLSRTDCELSCDEAAVVGMGEETRIDYGRTLISMISVGRKPDTILCAATMMSSGATKIKRRLELIINNKKSVISALVVTVILLTVAACATFTSALSPEEESYEIDTLVEMGDESFISEPLSIIDNSDSIDLPNQVEIEVMPEVDIKQEHEFTNEDYIEVYKKHFWGPGATEHEIVLFEKVDRDEFEDLVKRIEAFREYIENEYTDRKLYTVIPDLPYTDLYKIEIKFPQTIEHFNFYLIDYTEDIIPFRREGDYTIWTRYCYIQVIDRELVLTYLLDY